MDLILWRHADAHDARLGETDAQRALTPLGLQQAQAMGAWLQGVLPAHTRVLVSPALRTQQTAQALGRPFETVDALASGASMQSLLAAAAWPSGGGTVLVVGHQPTLGLVAASLLSGHRQHWVVHKASVWWLRAEPYRPHATLVAMRAPEHA